MRIYNILMKVCWKFQNCVAIWSLSFDVFFDSPNVRCCSPSGISHLGLIITWTEYLVLVRSKGGNDYAGFGKYFISVQTSLQFGQIVKQINGAILTQCQPCSECELGCNPCIGHWVAALSSYHKRKCFLPTPHTAVSNSS